jgi:hypothetical protein
MAVLLGSINDIRIGNTNNIYQSILKEINDKKSVSYGNELMGWFAIANINRNVYTIMFNKTKFQQKDKDYFYKNAESWAKRVSQLIKKGY